MSLRHESADDPSSGVSGPRSVTDLLAAWLSGEELTEWQWTLLDELLVVIEEHVTGKPYFPHL